MKRITVDPPTSTNVAYTQYADINVADSVDLIIADGDDLSLTFLVFLLQESHH